jgi:ssDNA-binding Zn-finger/Zn-ribbon topoisomerase 1
MSAPICPKCSSPMRQITGSRGPFWSCTKYKEGCRGTRNIEAPAVSAPASSPAPKTFAPAQATIPMEPGPTADLVHELRRIGGYVGVTIDSLRKIQRELDRALGNAAPPVDEEEVPF